MKKAITNEEALAIRNKVEILRLKVKEKPELLKDLSEEAQKWILHMKPDFHTLDAFTQFEIINHLYSYEKKTNIKESINKRKRKIEIISSVLKSTTSAKLIELANKLSDFSNEIDVTKYDEEIQFAVYIMKYGTDVNKVIETKNKTFTIEKEVKAIRKRNRTITKKESKIFRKYKNIKNIHDNHDSIYKALISIMPADLAKVIESYTNDWNDTNEIFFKDIKKTLHNFVIENDDAVMGVLRNSKLFDFIDQQEKGKIR